MNNFVIILITFNFLKYVLCFRNMCPCFVSFIDYFGPLSCYINKIVTSNDRNLVTFKKPGTVLLMQNVDLGHTKVIQIRQRETLSHQGAIIHENCCSAAQWSLQTIQFTVQTFMIICHSREILDDYFAILGENISYF